MDNSSNTNSVDLIAQQKLHHQKIVGSFIKNKLQEYEYFLNKIITICNLVSSNFLSGINPVNTSDQDINFTFNAFVNTFQSLKDSLETATSQKTVWSDFSEVRHSSFFKECRNAITHDGFQIINAYTDGKYYIASNIERINDKGRFISFESPKEDILTLCLEFSFDLTVKIESIINQFGQNIPTLNSEDKIKSIETAFDNDFIPDFAKNLFNDNKVQILHIINGQSSDPITDIKKHITNLKNICENHLASPARVD